MPGMWKILHGQPETAQTLEGRTSELQEPTERRNDRLGFLAQSFVLTVEQVMNQRISPLNKTSKVLD